MTTKTKTQFVNLKQASDKTKDIVEKLQADMLRTKSGDGFKSYLDFLSGQTAYSINNTILIWSQGGQTVRGGKAWKKAGRKVIDWNQKIWILAPVIIKVDIENEHGQLIYENGEKVQADKLIGFREIYVFDVSNTKGKPLPVNPLKATWELDETTLGKTMWEKFLDAMKKENIAIEYLTDGNTSLKGCTNGKVIKVNKNLSDHDKFLVGVHEYAHYVNHFNDDRFTLTKEVKELQAESIAYVMAEKFGMQSNGIEYCALYHREHDLLDSLKVIVKTVKTLTNLLG